MNCREFVEFLIDYVDGDLPEAQRSVFDRHTSECRPCQVYLETYRETIELGKTVCAVCDDPEGPVPDEVPEELVQAILRARRASGS